MVKRALRADQRVGLVEQRREVAVEQPGLLHELELAGDVGVQAHEQQAALGCRRPCIRSAERGPVFAAAAQDAVVVCGVEQGLRRRLRPAPARRADWPGARASPAGSRGRADRSAQKPKSFCGWPNSSAGQRRRLGHSRWPSMLRPTMRSASQSAVTWLASGSWARMLRGIVLQRFPERGDMLLQLAHHHVAAVEAEIEEALRAPRPADELGLARLRVVGGTTGPGAIS